MQYQVKYIIAQVGVEPTSLGHAPSKLPLLYRSVDNPSYNRVFEFFIPNPYSDNY